jgi:hypothetical protein
MSRLHIGKFDGTDVWEGPCEGCATVTRIVYGESVGRYLCGTCLRQKGKREPGFAFRLDPAYRYPTTINGHSVPRIGANRGSNVSFRSIMNRQKAYEIKVANLLYLVE